MRSPPERLPTFFCWSLPAKLKLATYARELTSRFPTMIFSSPPEISCQTFFVGIQGVAALVHVGELDGLADAQDARVGLLLADDHAKEGGLAGAVRADHADDAAAREREIEVVDEEAIAVGLLEVLGLDHDVAEARATEGMWISVPSGAFLAWSSA